MSLHSGFQKADMNNIPSVGIEAIYNYMQAARGAGDALTANQLEEMEFRVDFVQIGNYQGKYCDARCVVFPKFDGGAQLFVHVAVRVDRSRHHIVEALCECSSTGSCGHILTFMFWLNLRGCDVSSPITGDFWGSEGFRYSDEQLPTTALRMSDVYGDADMMVAVAAANPGEDVTDAQGEAFLTAILDEMQNMRQCHCAFYKHCRSPLEEFDPLFIHHTMIKASKNWVVRDSSIFLQYMEGQVKRGLANRLADVSRSSYKSVLWFEAQYMRLRCSLIYRVGWRESAKDDKQILNAMFCKKRERRIGERQTNKHHKRFILRMSSRKFSTKRYVPCGLLICKAYPFICASPDGITDDHIIEIKVPQSVDEVEKYLNGNKISPKYMTQLQIQMFVTNKRKALYCVLSPNFMETHELNYVWVQADVEFTNSLLHAAKAFWNEVVFPRLVKIYLKKASPVLANLTN